MGIRLPKPIEIYFASENLHDPAALDTCFAADATVRDERQTIITAETQTPVASDSGDDARGRDLADPLVPRVGDEQISDRINSHSRRVV